MKEVNQQQGETAPGDGHRQADVPVDVQGLVRVIPIAHVEESFHHRAGDVFQHSGPHHAQQKDQGRPAPGGQGKQKDHDRPRAIDGQPGAVEKPSVDPLAAFQGNIAGFPDPAQHTIEEKEQDPLVLGIRFHGTFPLFSAGTCLSLYSWPAFLSMNTDKGEGKHAPPPPVSLSCPHGTSITFKISFFSRPMIRFSSREM